MFRISEPSGDEDDLALLSPEVRMKYMHALGTYLNIKDLNIKQMCIYLSNNNIRTFFEINLQI